MASCAADIIKSPAVGSQRRMFKTPLTGFNQIFVNFIFNPSNMLATPVYHRTRPYSDHELYMAIMAYLEHDFVFRKLEIDEWLGDDRILYKHKEKYDAADFTSGKTSEELWSDGAFEDW